VLCLLFSRFSFRLNKHIPGLVDSYFGPKHLSEEVEKEPVISLKKLRAQLRELRQGATGIEDDIRRTFFIKQLYALEVLLEEQLGIELSFKDRVAKLFDLDVSPIPNKELDELRYQIRALLSKKPKRSYLETVQDWERGRQVFGRQLFLFLNDLLKQYKERTRRLLDLPKKEKVILKEVSGKSWPAYNWYQGQASSSVEINTDTRRTRYELASMLAHETYPGHHTELSIKEKVTYEKNRWLEVSIQLLNTPMCAISEGIADCGLKFLEEVEPVDYADEKEKLLSEKLANLRMAAWVNTIFILYYQNESPEVAVQYLHENSFLPIERARSSLNFHLHPLTRMYALTYWWGRKLIWDTYKDATEAGKTREFFTTLYCLPLCPSTLLRLRKNLHKFTQQ
jgi:hypothetical protein